MVIQQRSELRRNRVLYFVSLILAFTVVGGVTWEYARVIPTLQTVLAILALLAIGTIVLASIQLYSSPKRSHAVIIQRENDMVIATNAVHEGFKLRFLRDVLSENVFSFSDTDREMFRPLEADGYYPSLVVRNVRKVLLLRLCTLLFDDVYCVDPTDRWEHYDSSNTSEPSFHKREMPRFRAWKGTAS